MVSNGLRLVDCLISMEYRKGVDSKGRIDIVYGCKFPSPGSNKLRNPEQLSLSSTDTHLGDSSDEQFSVDSLHIQ